MLRSLKFVCLMIVAALSVAALPAAAAPALTSISPTSGYPGTQVTYTGTGFGATQGSGSVWLGNKLAGSIVSWSNTQIVAVVAATAASGSAQVQQGGTWSNSITFTVIKPNITSISPTSGYPGSQVTINGTNFGASQGSGSVWLGNKLAGSIVSWSSTQIVAVVAATALSGSAQVQQNGVWGNSVTFTVIQPNITSITPTSGYPGSQVTINGTNFGASQGSGSVWLGNKLAGSIVSWSNTQVVATVAATALSGSAIVQQGGVWSNSVTFTVIQPNITSITPTSGPVGTQVTINGTNFGATQGSGSVWLGSKLAGSIVSWSNTQIVATVDSGSVTGSAIVQQGGVWSNSIAFTVATPALTSIDPDTARAGDEITLTGTNFGATQGSGSVWLGSKLAAGIVSWSNTEIVATVDSGSVTGNAIVQQGGVWSNSIELAVITPVVNYLSPDIGPGSTEVTIDGSGFGATQGSGLVFIGTKYATVVSWSDNTVVAIVAQDSETGVAQIYQNGVWSNGVTFEVGYPAPPEATFYFTVSELVVGGFGNGYGIVYSSQLAPAGGLVISLSSSEATVTVPATVTIPEGVYTGGFQIETEEVTELLEATITATYNDTTRQDVIGVQPPGVQYVYFDVWDVPLAHGDTSIATVTLHKPAPAGGAVVSLVTDNPALLSMPATVTVAEGETQATFTATAGGPVATTQVVFVTGTYNGTSQRSQNLYIAPPTVTAITVTPSTVEGGQDVTVEVTLSEPAAAGTIVYLGATTNEAYSPGPLAFAEDATTAQRTFTTGYVESTQTALITAQIDGMGSSVSASLTLEPLALTLDSVSVSPTAVVGSNPATLTVTLTEPAETGGLEVDLFGYGAGVPPFVVVPEGETSATVPVETPAVTETQQAGLGARHAVTERSTQLQIDPPSGNFVEALTLATSRTAGGNLVTATVTLDAAAGDDGAVIALVSDNLAVATVPATVTIAEGETTETFDIDTDAVMDPADVTIRATYGVIRKARLTVVPTEATVSLVDLTLAEPVVYYGGDVDATVTLSSAAPAGGIVVTLGGSRDGIATVPASVTVPEGETSATFTIDSDQVDDDRFILVTATYGGLVRSQLLQVSRGVE